MSDPVLFLDCDGCLNNHRPQENNYCGTLSSCVSQFNRILDAIPEAKIVVSSAWRYLILNGSMTLKGFEMLLLTHGVKCYGRVIGHTVADGPIDAEPSHHDIRWCHTPTYRMPGTNRACMTLGRQTETLTPGVQNTTQERTIMQDRQNQAIADCEFLESTKTVGPSRYAQMTPEIYEIFERWDIDATSIAPSQAIAIIREKSEASDGCFFCSKADCQNECLSSV